MGITILVMTGGQRDEGAARWFGVETLGGDVDKEALGRLLVDTAYLKGDFVLRSGKRSKYYLDKYLFETDPDVLRGIVHEMAMMVRNQLALGEEYQRLAAPDSL